MNDLEIPNDFSGKKADGKYFIPKAYDNPRFIIEEVNDNSPNFKNSSLYGFWPSGEENIFFFSNHQGLYDVLAIFQIFKFIKL